MGGKEKKEKEGKIPSQFTLLFTLLPRQHPHTQSHIARRCNIIDLDIFMED